MKDGMITNLLCPLPFPFLLAAFRFCLDAPLLPPAGAWTVFCGVHAVGFAGLIYESIWSHYLKLSSPCGYAQTLVLAIFMGGRRSARGSPPLYPPLA